MSDEREVLFEDDTEVVEVPDEEIQWSHEVLNQFELLIDSLGVETVTFLLREEHEKILSTWFKHKVDIQNRRKH
jgi:hypothetical protein